MDAAPLGGNSARRRRWEWLLLLLAALMSFACIFLATSLAISRPPQRLTSPALLASGRADYGEVPGERRRFGPLHPGVGVEAALDAAGLRLTVPASQVDASGALTVLPLPPTPTLASVPMPKNSTYAGTTAFGTPFILTPSPGLPTGTPTGALPMPSSTVTSTPQPTATATRVILPTPTPTTASPNMPTPTGTSPSTPIPTATPGFTPPPTAKPPNTSTPTATFTPVPPTPTDTPEPTPSPTPTNTPTPANAPPVALDDMAATGEDAAVAIHVVTNDSDPDMNLDVNSVAGVTGPISGTLNITGSGYITYTPQTDLNGVDIFTYQVCDTGMPVLCDTATVTVTIAPLNDPPWANDDTMYITLGTPASIAVLANDADIDGNLDPTSVVTVTDPLSGTVNIDPAGLITYTSIISFSGIDSFDYQVCDSGAPALCDTANVMVVVNNLAQGKPVQESSYHNGDQKGDKAVDGDVDTFWRTAHDSPLPSEWIVVDLEGSLSISQVVLRWGNFYATSYVVQISPDGVSWTTIFTTTSGDGGVDVISFSPTSGRYVKMESTAWSEGPWRIRLNEFEIFP